MALETETLFSDIEMLDSNKSCYCCSIHGCVKDIYTEYYDTGECEVYSEMIRSTFNINIAHDKQTNLPLTFRKIYICEYCIGQLRNAYTFKTTIMKNHKDFLWRLMKWQKADLIEDETKIHKIKSECIHSDDETLDFTDDQPKESENQSKIIIKNESIEDSMIKSINQQIGLIDTKIEPDERKRKKVAKMSTLNSENKLKSSRKTKVNRRNNNNLDGVRKRTKNSGAVGTILRENSLKLILNSSLCVFQWKQHGEYTCYLCRESFIDIQLLKVHTKTHTIREIEEKITNSNNGRVKVEITDLFCKNCGLKLDNLLDLQKHLKTHNIVVKDHLLVPFKLNNEFKCQICSKIFKNFRLLKSHMLKHYQSYVCEICGSEFYKKEYLAGHIKNRHTEIKKNDLKNKNFKCRICETKFSTYPRKLEHMVQSHGVEKPQFPCKLCTKVYIIKGLLNRHMKLSHLKESKEKNYECDVCFKRFHRSHDVKRHKETHTEGLNYSCGFCNHSFKLKTSLDRHMRKMHR